MYSVKSIPVIEIAAFVTFASINTSTFLRVKSPVMFVLVLDEIVNVRLVSVTDTDITHVPF